jgi:hypothetical protein
VKVHARVSDVDGTTEAVERYVLSRDLPAIGAPR